MFASLVVVIGAITAGLICSGKVKSYRFNRRANAVSVFVFVVCVFFLLLVFI